jgi:peroxiredoxin
MTNTSLADALRATCDPDWQPHYDILVDRLRRAGVGANAPRVGDTFPDFALPDAQGRYRSLGTLLSGGPLVLSFNRGGWCPFCRHELAAWAAMLPALAARGAAFAAVTGEVGGRAAALATIFVDPMTMLCDVDHGVALDLGLAFHLGAPMLDRYRGYGLDLGLAYGSQAGLMAVPATFLIDRNGVVLYAYADPDFRERADPADVIAALVASDD